MALSWFLLFAFVAQWLITRYGAEKELLRKELDRQFMDAGMQVVDTTLTIHIIDPLFKERQQMGVTITHADSGRRNFSNLRSIDTMTRIFKGTGNPGRMITLNVSDSASKFIVLNKHDRRNIDSGDMVLQSIRLIVSNALDTGRHPSVFKQILTSKIDTALFRKLFLEKMNKQGQNFTVTWISGPVKDSVRKQDSRILLRSRIFEGMVGADISRFSWYIIKRLLPQILFTMVLLLVTGFSIIFTYRTLKKQVLLNDLRNDFIGNITHELKTPVSTVKVALESLMSFDMKKDPVVSADYLNMAAREIDRLDQLIYKVLNISRLGDTNNIVVLHPADLKSLVEKVIRGMTLRLENEKAEIVLEAPEASYICPVDVLFIEGVLMNLIDNSLKYAGNEPRIRIMLTQDQHYVFLSVIDNGPGIPGKYISNVFDKFFRVPTGDRHDVSGHGLGLSYAAQVMKQHNGTIDVRNPEHGGCAFTLTFRKG